MGSAAPADLLDVASDAARRAGDLLLERFAAPRDALRSKTSPTDLVSEADLESERLIRALLAERRPGDAILGEEGGGETEPVAPGALRWVVDPLDGTINFLFGVPQWAVSVACEDSDGPLVGVVHDAVRRETFTALRGGDATVNGAPIRGSETVDLSTALVATGFAYRAEWRALQAEVLARVLPRVRDIRRAGSAALDLAWTACARHDAFYERGIQAWDSRAGELLCMRAGLEVRRLEPSAVLPGGLVVAPAGLVEPLLALVGP
jgi:myo-inositol-1(or 4)-monophosphatase